MWLLGSGHFRGKRGAFGRTGREDAIARNIRQKILIAWITMIMGSNRVMPCERKIGGFLLAFGQRVMFYSSTTTSPVHVAYSSEVR